MYFKNFFLKESCLPKLAFIKNNFIGVKEIIPLPRNSLKHYIHF